MVITPSTDIYLLKSPLEISDINQLTFRNATAQYNYFNSLPKIGVNDYSYQRKDGTIRYGGNFDDIIGYNYVMYRNDAYSNKWFYAYITGMEYLNDNVTAVSIKTDVYQTWMFDLEYKDVFVEREHVNDDTVGLHTLPENLDLGEYEINKTQHLTFNGIEEELYGTKWYVCFVVTTPPDPNNPIPIIQNTGYNIGGVFSPLVYFAVSTDNNYDDAKDIIDWYNQEGGTTADAIINIYMIPAISVDTDTSRTWTNSTTGTSITVYGIKSSETTVNYPVNQESVLSGLYTPRNRKLYTYPYSYLYLSNKSGEDVVYKWEDGDFDENEGLCYYRFKNIIVPSASLSAKTFPIGYKKKNEASSYYGLLNYGVNFGKVPVCAWVTDYYTNWLTQNGVNVGLSMVGSATSIITGGVTGAISGGLGIANSLAEMYKASVVPDQAKGDTNVGDVTFAYTFNNITAYQMTIRREYSEIIDRYFDMYGYKVNSVKRPNITGRRIWNYVKTIGCYIAGDVPQDDLNEIKAMFDNGVTFWHNPNTFMDYSQNNDII